jgi:hypothetical protein
MDGGFDEKRTCCGSTAVDGAEWYDVDGVVSDGKGRVTPVDRVLLDRLGECECFLCFVYLELEWCCEWGITFITCIDTWLGGYCCWASMGDGDRK